MNARLRIGVVGAGQVLERYHHPAINAVPEVVRSTVIDSDEQRARKAAERFGFPRWSTDLADAVRHADVAIVLVPNGFHAKISCELLAQGVHVLCEKPMARNVDECLSMIEAARRGRTQLCVGHNRRFRQHFWLAKELLSRGLIGEMVSVSAEEGSTQDWPRSADRVFKVLSLLPALAIQRHSPRVTTRLRLRGLSGSSSFFSPVYKPSNCAGIILGANAAYSSPSRGSSNSRSAASRTRLSAA